MARPETVFIGRRANGMSQGSHEWLVTLALSLVASTTSVTIGKARIFREVRRLACAWSPWLGELLHCPYCLSHWIALALVLAYRPSLVRGTFPVLDALVGLFVIVALASVWSRLICDALDAMDRLGDAESETSNRRRNA